MSQPTFKGQSPDHGRIVVGRQYPGEGYAVLRCGGTEVQIGYTLLHHLHVRIDGRWSEPVADLAALQQAFDAVTCEASLGRTGDTEMVELSARRSAKDPTGGTA